MRERNHRLGRDAMIAVALALGALALASPALWGELVYDDAVLITLDERVHSISRWHDWFLTPYWPREPVHGKWRPLITAGYGLTHAIVGLEPFAYHLTNLLLHAMATALVFGVGRRMGLSRPAAALGGLLFAVHPVHAEVAACIVYRTDSLAALAVFLALAIFLGRDRETLRWSQVVGVSACFAVGLLIKESVLLLPLGLVLVEIFLCPRRRRAGAVRHRLMTLAIAMAVLALAHALIVIALCGHWGVPEAERAHSGTTAWTRLPLVPWAMGQFTRLLLWPITLSAEYHHPLPEVGNAARALFGLAVLGIIAAAVAVAAALRRRAPVVAFSLLWTGLMLGPYLHLIGFGAVLAERFAYIASAGVCWALGGVWDATPLRRRGPFLVAALLIMALFAGRTLSHVRSWRTGLTLWEASVTTGHVGPHGWYNLALMRLEVDDTEGAREATETAIALGLDMPQCHVLIAMAAFNGGDPAESERVARAALARWPDHAELIQVLSVNLAQRGAWRELEALHRAQELTPP
jgi:protein O-mannosyl-transferase